MKWKSSSQGTQQPSRCGLRSAITTALTAGLLLSVGLFWSTSRAMAQDESSSTGPELTYVVEGSRAPFSGMLFPVERAVAWRQRIELLEERLRLDVERCEETGRIRLDLARETLMVERERGTRDASTYREALARTGERKWWESPVLWVVVGAVLGGALVAAIASAVQ